MSTKARMRLIAQTEHREREILSVLERSDGELQIFLRPSKNFEDPDLGNIEISADKISIHRSPASTGTTIIHKLHLKDGRMISSALFVENSAKTLLAMALSETVPSSNETHQRNIRTKDRIYSLPNYNEDSNTLVVSVMVSSKDISPEISIDCPLSYMSIPFSIFNLHIFWGYIQATSSVFKEVAWVGSSPMQDTKNPLAPQYKGVASLTPSNAPGMIKLICWQFCKMTYRRWLDLNRRSLDAGMPALPLADILQGCSLILRAPNEALLDRVTHEPLPVFIGEPEVDMPGYSATIDGECVGRFYPDIAP
jgi:hypothetical protein